ncbi:MAG: D-alanyl-D-alanine carboxypeptidase [Clostridia bacterium]|nr:D-alanyl-D-alanine carboxypeptidase [Clostridia bacterium]
MKKLFSFFLCLLTVLLLFVPCSSAIFDSGTVTSQINSDIYYLENLDEGTVFFEKDSTVKAPAAGFVKLIAAIVAIEKWGNLDGEIKLTEANLNTFEYIYGMLTVLYEEGETVSKKELFDCLMVSNANDALSVIAYEVSGSEAAFLAEMQALVGKIGCTSTVLKNIHGFDEEGQYTTAADVAKIIKYGLQYPAFSEAFSLSEVTLKQTDKNDERIYTSSNKMKNAAIADYYHSSVTGGKQTSTDLAGQCIAVLSVADGYSYLCVVMGGELADIDGDYYDENTSMTDTKMMLEWVYENIRYKVVANADQSIAAVDVIAGQGTRRLKLIPEKETSALVPGNVTPASVMFEAVELPETIVAPVKAGDVIAKANVYYAGHRLTQINLVAAETIRLSFAGLMLTAVKGIIGSTFFMVVTFVLAFIAVLRFLLDLKDFFDKKRRSSFDPLPSSFDVLTKKIAGAFRPKKNKKKTGAKKAASAKDAKVSAPKKTVADKKSTGKDIPVKNNTTARKATKSVPDRKKTVKSGKKATRKAPAVGKNVNKNQGK